MENKIGESISEDVRVKREQLATLFASGMRNENLNPEQSCRRMFANRYKDGAH